MADTDFAKQKAAIRGRFTREDELALLWMPEYIKEFPQAVNGISLKWEKCKFIRAGSNLVPKAFGVYCFSISLGEPFPDGIHVPLYIGKASDQYL